jgi:hypothetical protein
LERNSTTNRKKKNNISGQVESLLLKFTIMKLILKFAACALLIEIIIFVSCKKDPAATKDNHHPPVANAGQDVNVAQTSCSPSNVIQLNGSHSSDADDNISSYPWTKISGPSQITLSNSTTPILRLEVCSWAVRF